VNDVAGNDFESFVATRTGALLRYAFVLTGDRHQAEDLVQSALASSYRHWRRIDPGTAERYVRAAVLNSYLSWWRRPSRRREVLTQDITPFSDLQGGGPGSDQGLDLRDDMWRALATLPPRQRAVVVLRYFEDLTEAETAARMNVSLGTVKSQHSKALRSLQDIVNGQSIDGPRTAGGVR
jgi:RNA polymerase sigma-70 factor (sigma-E family)